MLSREYHDFVPHNAHFGVQVDWTIQLIVINSKLSGANSFQATVEYCYGKSGLVAISVRAMSIWESWH